MRKFLNALGGIMIAVFAFCIVTLVLASTHGNTFSQEIVSWFDKPEEQTEELPNDELSTTSVIRLNSSSEESPYSKIYLTSFQYLADFSVDTVQLSSSDDVTRVKHTLTGTMPLSSFKLLNVDKGYTSGDPSTAEYITWRNDGNVITCVIEHLGCHSQEYFYFRDMQIQYSFTKYDGKDLTGVYTDAVLTQAYTGTGAVGPVLYPGYTAKQFTVELNTGLSNSAQTVSVTYGKSPELPELEREGYIFQGWLDENGYPYVDAPIYQNTVITAKWAPEIVTVKVYVADFLYGSVDVAYGTKVSDVLEDLNLKYTIVEKTLNLKDEELSTLRYHDELTQDVKLYVRDQTDLDKVDTFVTSYWYVFVAVAAFVILGIVLGLTQKKKKRGYRR